MGDLIEFTTIPRERTAFFKVSSGGLKVDIKGETSAAIGLQSVLDDDDSECDYVVVLGHRSYIYKSRSEGIVANTPNLLSSHEYRSFWIQWDSQYIRLGRAGDKDPIVLYRNALNIKPLNYVIFGANCDEGTINWKFELAPQIPRPELKSFCGGGPRWVNAGDQLPHGAINGGYENGTLYIIRARHRGSLTPGKFVPSEGQGYISWGGDAHEKEEFEVLVGYNYAWVPTSVNKIPAGAVVGGYSEDFQRQELFVGRARHGKHIIPGKVQPSHSVCYVPYDGKECGHRDFEILVSLDNNKRSFQKLYASSEMLYTEPPTNYDNDDYVMDLHLGR